MAIQSNNNANTAFNNPIILAADMPYARLFAERYTGTSTGVSTVTIPSLTIMGSNTLQGSSLVVNNNSTTNSANQRCTKWMASSASKLMPPPTAFWCSSRHSVKPWA